MSSAWSQAVVSPWEIQASGEEYLSKLRLRGVQSDVVYFDPLGPAPELDTRESPEDEKTPSERARNVEIDVPVMLITTVILCACAYMFWRYGGASGLALKRELRNPNRSTSQSVNALFDGSDEIKELGVILENPDRQAALINLSQLLVFHAVKANGLLLQRSWTVRDVLRRMPNSASWLPELRELVLTGERVHFRDQAVSEEDFQGFATRARPILRELAA